MFSIFKSKRRTSALFALTAVIAVATAVVAIASSVNTAVVDTTAPTNSVSVAAGSSAPITLRMTVTGNQEGTATFKINRTWTLNATGTGFTGSNPQTFTVDQRTSQDPADVFEATGTVSIPASRAAGGPYTLAASAFDITNSNENGAKLSAGNASNYQVTVVAGSKQDQTITFPTPTPSKTYGDAAFDPDADASSGLDVTYASKTPTVCGIDSNLVTILAAGTCTITGSQSGNGSYNAAPNVDETYTISRKSISGSFTAANKEYDGNATATITGSSLGSGVVSGDSLSLNGSGATASFANKNVGNGKTVTATGFALAGDDMANYSLSMGTTTADITAKSISGSFTAANKVYDGNTTATITNRSLNGAVSGDLVSLIGGSAAFANANAGNGKTVNAGTGFSLSGDDAPNYTLSSVGDTTANINERPVTVNAHNKSKVLNASDPALTYGYASGSLELVGGDTFSGSLSRDAGESIGSYTIRQGTLTAGTNYNLTVNTGTLSITYAATGADCAGVPGRTILQPINVNGSSVFKQGSTVPAKFRVCDANGEPVGGTGVVTSFKLVRKVSGTLVTTPNEEVISTSADSGFRWSSTDRQWIFNMSTKNLTANATYHYEISLNDGSKIEYQFGLR